MIAIEVSSADGIEKPVLQKLLATKRLSCRQTAFELYDCTTVPVSWLIDRDDEADQARRASLYRGRLLAGSAESAGAPPPRVVTLLPRNVVAAKRNDGSTAVFAVLNPAPGSRDLVCTLLDRMMEQTREEAGNHYYNLYESAEDGSLWMFEAYADAAALQAHRASPYYQAHVPQIAKQLSGPIRVHMLAKLLSE
jgi:quinol monooxygenase YgiN